MLLEKAANGADFRMRYYNRDGGEAEMCGNGARWVATLLLRGKTPPSLGMKTLFVAIALVTALSVSGQENPELAPRAMPVNAGPNDIARFLAGMPVPENSPLALLTRDPAWQEHATFFEKEFSKHYLFS